MPNLALIAPMIVVRSSSGRLACCLVSVRLEQVLGRASNGRCTELVKDYSRAGLAKQPRYLNQVANYHGNSSLQVVKNLIGQAPAVIGRLGLVKAKSQVCRLGQALQLGALHPAQKADVGNSARGAVLLKGFQYVSAAHDQEFDLGTEGRCIHELFGSSVHVNSCALQNPYGFVLGKLQFPAQNLTPRLRSVPLAVGRPGQFGLQGHVANQVP